MASSEGGGIAAGRLCGGNLKSDRSGRVKWIEGPDMMVVVKRTRRDESMMWCEGAKGDSNVDDYARSMACFLLDSGSLMM